MKFVRVVKGVGAAVVFAALFHSAQAFEVEGFRARMSLEEALLVAQKYDAEPTVVKSPDERAASIEVFETGKYRDEFVHLQLSFCEDELVQYRKYFPMRLDTLSEAVARMTAQYGNPIVRTISDEKKIESQGKPIGILVYHELEFSFTDKDNDNISADVSLVQTTTKTPDVERVGIFARHPRGSLDVFEIHRDANGMNACEDVAWFPAKE